VRYLGFKKDLCSQLIGEVGVRLAGATLLVGLTACSDHTQPAAPEKAPTTSAPESYSVLLKEKDQMWCAYRNQAEFQAEAEELNPTENANVTFSAGKPSAITHVVAAESGDWVVIDTYTPRDSEVTLRRENRLMQGEGVEVTQEAAIREGRSGPFQLVTVTTLDGKKVDLPPNLDYPPVSPLTDLPAANFVRVVSELRGGSLGKLCKKME
jgi:hypothetical protein